MADLTKVVKRDLSQARTNERLPVFSRGWIVDQIDGPATLRVASTDGYPYPLRNFDLVELPVREDEFFLSNPSTSGNLIIHFLRKEGLEPKISNGGGGGDGGLPITDTVERGLDLTKNNQIILDTSSFGRPQVEVIAITYDSNGDYPGSTVDFYLYGSTDKIKWYRVDKYIGDRWTGSGRDNALRYIMLENSGDGLAGETCDLILSASE